MRRKRSYSAKPKEITRQWWIVDAQGKTLGRLAVKVANILRGKNKPIFTPHMDTGDFVIIINAQGIRVTGGKETKKTYFRHSGYPGGGRSVDLRTLLQKKPEEVLRRAIRGMLPSSKLGKAILKKLKIYPGSQHPHESQRPKKLEL